MEKIIKVIKMIYILISSAVSYIIGSINFAIIFSSFLHSEDIRKKGSKNAGATNIMRIYGKKAGITVFLCDFLKGIIAVFAARILIYFLGAPYETALFAGFFVQFGHIYPIFFGFRGGKGVATAAGAAFAIMPLTAVILIGVFAVIAFSSKIVSLASGICAALYPLLALNFGKENGKALFIFSACCSALILIKHITNINMLINGKENKI